MVIDDFPQWFERFFVFIALVVAVGVWNACSHLAGIGRQLEALGSILQDHDIDDIAEDIRAVRHELDSIGSNVGNIADPDARKRRSAAALDRYRASKRSDKS